MALGKETVETPPRTADGLGNAVIKREEKQGFCTLCRSRCGTINTVIAGALVAVHPDPSHPTGQSICMKGRAAPELVHSPHRLRYPMRRTRPKGAADPGWVRISWEDALGETAARLAAIREQSGAQAVAFAVTTPSGTPLSDSIDWTERFVGLFGSPNICYATELCNWHKDVAHAFTFGCGMPVADYANADLMLLWGHNPASTWLAQAQAIGRGREAGAKLMVVDPRPTALATQAQSWLPVRPGTDAALALGLIHLLIEGERFDADFVRDWTNAPLLVRSDNGRFLRERDIDPTCAADHYLAWDVRCGAPMPYDTRLAAKPQGSEHFALDGEFDIDAGSMKPMRTTRLRCTPVFELLKRAAAAYPPNRVAQITDVSQVALRDAAALLASSRRVAYHAWTGIGQHTNATQSERAVATLYALLGCFDQRGGNRLFGRPSVRVVNDLDLLAPAQHAKALGLAKRPIGPPAQGEARSDNEIVFDLATRLGLGKEFFGGSVEAGWNHMLEPLGLSVEQLRHRPEGVACAIDAAEVKYARGTTDGVAGFATETRRVELYSELLLRHGQPPLPAFVEPADSPRDQESTPQGRYPYVLTSAKSGYYCHSQHRSLASLRKRAAVPTAEISSSLASEKQIAEGDWIRISTRAGHARFVARILPGLAHDVVVGQFGWWWACPELGREGYGVDGEFSSNFNLLISSDAHDPISGSVAHRSFLCNVERDPLVAARQRTWSGWRAFRVTERRFQAVDVLGLRFAAVDGGELPDYLPGQHITLRVLAGDEGELTRAYSLTGAASLDHRHEYTIAVRHQRGLTATGEPYQGRMSAHLHLNVTVGDIVELRAPGGGFVLPLRSTQPLVLMAAGIGITPFISLLESLRGRSDLPEVWLYGAHRNSQTHAFRAGVENLVDALPCLRVIDHYSSPLATDRCGVDFASLDRLVAASIDASLIERRARFYLCGPLTMMEELTRGLIERGVPSFDIFREVFRSPAAMPKDGLSQCKVSFARSGMAPVDWTPERGTLLQLGESIGLNMASGCRVGQCESCAIRLVSGRVHHLHGADPEDITSCLACQAVPVGDVVIDALGDACNYCVAGPSPLCKLVEAGADRAEHRQRVRSRGQPCFGGTVAHHGCARSNWPANRNRVASSP